MIPRVIHYCWFGGKPLPSIIEECISTWRQQMPDFQIKRWDETNWSIDSNSYAHEQWKRNKFAFVSDVCRMDVLLREGGIYLDTDVIVKKTLAPFLHHSAFLGMMFSDSVGTAVIGAEPGHPLINTIRKHYDDLDVSDRPNNDFVTGLLIDHYQEFVLANSRQMLRDGIAIYPRHYFERFSNHPKRGYTQHLVTNTWQENSRNFSGITEVTGATFPKLREVVSNARFIPRAAHFETFLKHKLQLRRVRKDSSLI